MHEQERPASRIQALERWLTNVFWYHYKWYYLIGLLAAAFLISGMLRAALRVDYDWIVPYVHSGTADTAAGEALRARLEAAAPDANGNGRVQVRIVDYAQREKPGRLDALGLLQQPDTLLLLLDADSYGLLRKLGRLEEGVPLGDGVYLAAHDAPVTLYRLEDYEDQGYSQEQIDLSNAYLKSEHARLLALAQETLAALA